MSSRSTRRTVGIAVATLAVVAGPSLPAQDAECVSIESFAATTVGQFPAGWQARREAGKAVYRVQEERGFRFLRAAAVNVGLQAARQYEWDLARHPVLAWSWRPRQFPQGGDERDSATNDSALAVYVLVASSRIADPKALKYVWSERVPVGTHLTSNSGLTHLLVRRSGPNGVAERWVEERVNVLEDWKRLFDDRETPKPAGIAVLTDADDTRSRAEGDYANFRACQR
jgi:hypothetical protein